MSEKSQMAARRKMTLTLVLGTWLGASFLLLWVVGSSFPGVERAVVENERLASRVSFKPGDAAAKKTSVAWVITGAVSYTHLTLPTICSV